MFAAVVMLGFWAGCDAWDSFQPRHPLWVDAGRKVVHFPTKRAGIVTEYHPRENLAVVEFDGGEKGKFPPGELGPVD